MTTSAISLSGVTKTYGHASILDDVSFECPTGSIVAFVGPNGAGKSTTMRIICRLTRPTEGSVTVLGTPLEKLENPGRLMGSVLDPAAHHPGRSVRNTVALPAMMLNLPRQRVDEVIERLGLGSVQRRRFKALSLGMKQRVSLAIALLARPKILVLDEPMNGLDVDGIEWVRVFLRQFADSGGTVLVSSHLLNELQVFADRLVVISQGKIRTDENIAATTTYQSQTVAAEPQKLTDLLDGRGFSYVASGDTFTVDLPRDELARLAFDAGVLLLELKQADRSVSIERTYHDLTTGDYTMRGGA